MKRTSVWRLVWLGPALVLGLGGCAADKGEEVVDAESVKEEAAGKTAEVAKAATKAVRGSFSGTDALWNSDLSLGEPVATFGDEPVWTETTNKAANKGTTGKALTVVGEVVDVSCYMQLGKRGEAHIPCGTDCVRNGAPIGVVDGQNELYIVMAEEHDPRRYGNIALKEAMLPFMAKTVQVSGMVTERDGVKTLYVLGYTTGDNPNQPSGE